MAKKKTTNTIAKLNTARTIAESAKRPLHEVLSVIFLNKIIPSAFADDVAIFNNEKAEQIASLLPTRTRKVN